MYYADSQRVVKSHVRPYLANRRHQHDYNAHIPMALKYAASYITKRKLTRALIDEHHNQACVSCASAIIWLVKSYEIHLKPFIILQFIAVANHSDYNNTLLHVHPLLSANKFSFSMVFFVACPTRVFPLVPRNFMYVLMIIYYCNMIG